MGQHFLFHRELVAATAVHHAAYAALSNDYQRDLVVVGPQYLRVYRVEPLPEHATSQTDATSENGATISKADDESTAVEGDACAPPPPPGHVLHLLDSFQLAGVAESLRVLHFDARMLRKRRRFHGGKDVLLLSFSGYKWVLVGYDRRSRSLATLAMFAFGSESVGAGATLKGEREGREQLLGASSCAVACVDPQTRCGAMLVYGDQLVIVPFRSSSMEMSFFDEEDEDDDDDENGDDQGRRSTLANANGHPRSTRRRGAVNGGKEEDEEEDADEEEKKLEQLVKETKQRGMTSDMSKRLQTLLDKSVKIGVKRKRNHMSGLLSNELTGREFLLRLRQLDISGRVIDMAFLDGYLEPTLMLLHEENDKNATDGRFAGGFDTFCLTVISINLNTRLHPKIWTVKNLPSDSFRLIPCRSPVGGVVVLSAHAILYFNQTQFHGLATSVFADKSVNSTIFPLQEAVYETMSGQVEPLNILLDNCECDYLGKTELLLSLGDGTMYVLTLPYEDTSRYRSGGYGLGKSAGGSASLTLRQLPSGATPSCLCVDEERKTLFVGSRSGDSVLYAYHKKRVQEHAIENGHASLDEEDVANEKAKAGEPENGNTDAEDEEEDEEDEDDIFLYGSSVGKMSLTASAHDTNSTNGTEKDEDHQHDGRFRYGLRQVDVLPSVGQISSIELGLERNVDSNEHREQLVVGGGYLHCGSVSVLHSGLRPIVGTEAELSGCRAMWTVSSSLVSPTAPVSDDGRIFNSYLILSVGQRTMVLRTGEGMEPLEADSGFYTSGPTLAASNLFDKQRIVQIFKQGARVMMEVPAEHETKKAGQATDDGASENVGSDNNGTEDSESKAANEENEEEDDTDDDDELNVRLVCTQEVTLEGDVESGGMNVDTSRVGIVSVDVIDPYILLLLTDGTIRVLMGDAEDLELTVIDPDVRYDDGCAETTDPSTSALKICSACLFYDWAGMFRDNAWDDDVAATTTASTGESNSGPTNSEMSHDDKEVPNGEPAESKGNGHDGSGEHDEHDDGHDEEMESLYSTRSSHHAQSLASIREGEFHGAGATSQSSASAPLLREKDAAMMCGVCFDDGSLHVYSLPDFKKKGIFPYLTFAPQNLVNTMKHFHEGTQQEVSMPPPVLGINAMVSSANDGRIKRSHTFNSPIADIAIHRIGPSEGQLNSQYFARMVLLVFLANGDLVIYTALPKITSAGTPTTFQFVRVSSDLITRPYLAPKTKAGGAGGSSNNQEPGNAEVNTSAILAKLRAGFRYPMLTRFLNVNNMSGVFFRGAHPMWVISDRGSPTLVPMSVNATPSPSAPTSGRAPTPAVRVPVLSFTPFHHWNCPNGFIYFHSRGVLRVCELPSSKTTTILPSSNGFVLSKIEFGATVHHMLYMGKHGPGGVSEALEMPTYAIVCSRPMVPAVAEQATKEEVEEHDTGDAHGEGFDNGSDPALADGLDPSMLNTTANTSNIMAPTAEMYPDLAVEDMVHTEEDVYELRLVQTNEFGEWDRRGVFRVYFNRFEVVLSVKLMYLYDSSLLKDDVSSTSEEWNKKKKPYVVIGTGYVGPHGEDESGKGRLLLYELDYAQYATQSGSTSAKLPKLRLIFIKEHHQGAISCVTQLGPYVVAAVGMKMIVYEFKSDQLIGCAFYDAQMYIVSISVVKDYVMYGDVYKSVHFLRWKEKQRQLQLLAKDYEPLTITATEFSVFERRLALLATDMEDNLHVMQFAPQDIESRGGQRLLRTSDFHLGVQITSMFRKLAGEAAPPGSHANGTQRSGRHHRHQQQRPQPQNSVYVNILGSSEGSIAAIIPVGERVFRRLFTLQTVMVNTLPQNAALNPREFRTMKANGRRRTGRPDAWSKQKWKKGFLDALVLFRFLHLDYVAQKEMARCIGTTPEVIMHNLLEVQRATAGFL